MKAPYRNPGRVRGIFLLFHRWAGLIAAPFLILTGLTGAVISWDHELDDWLNPHLHAVQTQGERRSPLVLAQEVEARHPEIRVASLPLDVEPGESLVLFVQPRQNPATGKLFEPGFNQVFLDPITGEELGKRQWGAVWPINAENFVSFLYKLHYSLHLPEMFGSDRWGIWLLGGIAIGWTLDCFIALYLTLPARRRQKASDAKTMPRSFWQRWRPAWRIRWEGGAYKLNYDFHRAFGLWTWALLLILAFSAFALNLRREVFMPLMKSVATLSATPFEQRPRSPRHSPIDPKRSFKDILPLAESAAKARHWAEPAGRIGYFTNFGIYQVDFYAPKADHGLAGAGHRRLYFDGADGRLIGEKTPWTGTAGDVFVQAQFPLHSGRILGLPGRILISAMGLVVTMLSVTGVYIWWKKRTARRTQEARGFAPVSRECRLSQP